MALLSRLLVLIAALLLTLALASQSTALQYEVRNLGTLGGELCTGFVGQNSFATALNASSQVVGGSCKFVGFFQRVTHAFLWTSGLMTDLSGSDTTHSVALAINDTGDVVGYTSAFLTEGSSTAFVVFAGETLTSLGSVLGGFSRALDVNNRGEIVGLRGTSDRIDSWRAFHYDTVTGLVTDLPSLGGTFRSEAAAIRDSGEMVGYSTISGNSAFRAAFWTTPNSSPVDLGTLGGTHSFATGINTVGQIAGRSLLTSGDEHAVLWASPGALPRDLGTLGGRFSAAWGINRDGIVVGSSANASGFQRAFIYWRGMHDLNSFLPPESGWTLVEARAINDTGQIVGVGRFGGEERAFLLSPVDTTPPPDITPPEILVPGDIVVGQETPSGTVVTYQVTASDPDDDVASLACVPASGSLFPPGTTTVVCTAEDTNGNTATKSFKVTVDGLAPVLVLFDLIVEGETKSGTIVVYSVRAIDNVDASPDVVCSPASGTFLPVGETTVGCTATDDFGNSASGTFTITVLPPLDLRLKIDDLGSIDRQSGTVTVTGKVQCGYATTVFISGTLTQARGRTVIDGFFAVDVGCTPPGTSWSAVVSPNADAFRAGPASESASAFACPHGRCWEAVAEEELRLR